MPLLTKSRLILLNNKKLHSNILSRTAAKPSSIILVTNNTFSTNPHPKFTQEEIKDRLKHADDQRKIYRKQVSELRKQYKIEVDVKRQVEEREKERITTKEAIEVAQRRKIKLLKAIENERMQREIQAERRKAFGEYLKEVQIARDARRGRYKKARELVIKELEAESHLWMTTSAEVDKVLDDKNAMQELWANPYTIGARPPDSELWRFESHTADMSRSYPKRRELLLEDILSDVFAEENIDTTYWPNEKMDEVFQRNQRKKLHAMIRREGRRRLLRRQSELMKEHFTLAPNQKEAGVPLKLPPPDLNVLADEKMMEEEGLKALFENPESFLQIIDGKVVSIKDEFFHLPDGKPFPLFIGDDTPLNRPKKKEPTKKSKQQQKKESPAPDQEEESVDRFMDEESPEFLQSSKQVVSNDALENDEDFFIPEENRYTARDVDWVSEKLQTKINYFEQLEARESKSVASAQQELSQSNALGTRLPSAQESEQEDMMTQEIDLQEVVDIFKSLTPKQQEAIQDLNMEKLLEDPDISMEFIISSVANITDGRFNGTRLSREQVTKVVEAEYVLMNDKELAAELMEESQELEEKQNDGLLDHDIEDTSADHTDVIDAQQNDTTATDDKESK